MIFAMATGLLSVLLVAGYRRMALRHGWLDAPNQRSSHTTHTPRGAGIVFVLLISVAALWWWASAEIPPGLGFALLLGIGVAMVGWWDDLRGLGAGYRFGFYWLFTLAALVVLSLPLWQGLPAVGGSKLPLLIAGSIAALWLLNLYNFMDGINGIAAGEALFVLMAGLWLAMDTPVFPPLALVTGVAAGAIGGFMLWNFPVARVFMGDVGSAYIGFLFGVLMTWSDSAGGPALMVWLILLGGFVVDASYTLAVRFVTGQSWRQAHRLHAYQLLARRWGSHTRVVAALMLINIGWLFPWAIALHNHYVTPLTAGMGAYLPLIVICVCSGAGRERPAGV